MPEILVNNIKTYYEVKGTGSPFLLLHGWGSNSERWATVAEIISQKGYKVIIPDMPGFGKSDALTRAWTSNDYVSWSEEFIHQIGLEEFYLMGHSFGGALACKISIKYPQKVNKVFLVAAASVRKRTSKKDAYKFLSKIIKPFSFLPGYNFFRKAFYKFIIRRSDYPYVDGYLKETFLNIVGEDLSQFTGFIKVPTIIIWGDKDKYTQVDDAHFLNEKIKNSKLIIIPGAGHILNRECPEILAENILNNI